MENLTWQIKTCLPHRFDANQNKGNRSFVQVLNTCRDRLAIARAFLAKGIFGYATTRQLLFALRNDKGLRGLCRQAQAHQLPQEFTFSRAFADFANPNSPTSPTNAARLALGTRIQRQLEMTDPEQMLTDISTKCDIGAISSSKGNIMYWRAYKLHLDVADGGIPIFAVLTSARVHDSQVAIPMMHITSKRVTYLYDVMDSAYDAAAIHQASTKLNHRPVIHPHTWPKPKTQLPVRIKSSFRWQIYRSSGQAAISEKVPQAGDHALEKSFSLHFNNLRKSPSRILPGHLLALPLKSPAPPRGALLFGGNENDP